MERLVESLGVTILSELQRAAMAAELDERVEAVEAFGTRPVDWVRTVRGRRRAGLKVRETAQIVGVAMGDEKASGRNGLQE
jgi:hypothetical protein